MTSKRSKKYRRTVPHIAGNINGPTLYARGPQELTPEERKEAIRLRKLEWTFEQIADHLHATVADVKLALANMRTRIISPKRATLNVSVEAREKFVELYKLPREPIWRTFNRLMEIPNSDD